VDDAVFTGGFANADASASDALNLGVALNWLPAKNLKLSLDWEWTQFKGGAAGGGDRAPEEVFLARVSSFF
jgi:phosphate-selective porin OprO/OprP